MELKAEEGFMNLHVYLGNNTKRLTQFYALINKIFFFYDDDEERISESCIAA